jgi:hypothetical protein
MATEYRLNPGEQKQIPLEHRFLKVDFASLPLEVSGRNISAFSVKNKEVIDFLEPGKTVLIANRNDEVMVVRLSSQQFRVSGLDEVTLTDGTSVVLAPGSALDIANVTLTSGNKIILDVGSEVDLVQGAEVTTIKTGDFIGLPMLDFSTNLLQTVGANADRKKLHIIADPLNVNPIWIGSNQENTGIALYPGQSKEFEVTTQFNCYSTDSTAKAYLAEETV